MPKLLGKINRTILEGTFGSLRTDEVIVTDERYEHIRNHHPEALSDLERYGTDVIADPDQILRDGKNKDTVFLIKRLPGTNLNGIVKLEVERENEGSPYPDPKNTLLTFYRVREKNLLKLFAKNDLLYKKPDEYYNIDKENAVPKNDGSRECAATHPLG